jgi:hypothetical protein
VSEKYTPEELRGKARVVLNARNQGSPRYEVFLLMLMMRIGVFDRRAVEQRIEELAR